MLCVGTIAGLEGILGPLLPAADGAPSSEAATLGEANGAASEVGVADPGPAAAPAVALGVPVPPAFFFA